MSASLLLVRHGRASDDVDDYDWLSQTGERQMECLAADLLRRGPPARVWRGSQRRHAASVAILRRVLAEGGHHLAEPEVVSAVDEFDTSPMHATATDDAKTAAERRARYAEQLLARVDAWAHGRLAAPETFEAFLGRCTRAVARIADAGEHPKLVLTSGGVVAAVVASADPDPPSTFVARMRQMYTASVTEVVRDGGTWRVMRHGDTSHLPEELRIFY